MTLRLLRDTEAPFASIAKRIALRLGIVPALALGLTNAMAAGPSPEGVEFFESKIRPVLVKNCFSCHSSEAKSLKAGLRLDSAQAMRDGGEGGPAVVPGNVDESLLISALKYESSQMPPSGKLPEATIADFAKWVEMGAPDPRTAASAPAASESKKLDMAAARQFWSFRPPAPSSPKPVSDEAWARGPIDRHILAALDEKGLKPVRPAGKRELIRRATFDLTGLPPTPEEVDAFLADEAPDAFDRVVDRLLASPHYGERWGRYWLDVARYAEDQAHTFGVKPNSSGFRYRDWVVRALNDDLPYDRFVKLQIAGDQLPEGKNPPYDGRVALGFFGLGAQYYKNTDAAKATADELDDRVDTLTRGFLGLTVACARCHDHKFDPIPTQDYYSLAGIFSSSMLTNTPLVSDEEVKRHEHQEEQLKAAEAKLKGYRDQERVKFVASGVDRLDAYLIAARSCSSSGKKEPGNSVAEVAKREGLEPSILRRWVKLLDSGNESTQRLAGLASWQAFHAIGKDGSAESVAEAARGVRDEVRRSASRRVVTKADPVVEIDLDITGANRLFLVVSDGGDGQSCDWADWIEPKLVGPEGEKKLTELRWRSATSGSGSVLVGKNAGGDPLKVAGQLVADGIGTHAPSLIVFDLPDGYTRFRTKAGLDEGGTGQASDNGSATVQFLATTRKPETIEGALAFDGAVDMTKGDWLRFLFAEKGIFYIGDDDLAKRLDKDALGQIERLKAGVAEAKEGVSPPYPIAHSLVDATAADMHVFVRGNPAQPGDLAPRRFLRVLAGDEPPRFDKGSGRLDLAEAIASPDNPLTARVIVNRIWQHHFGRGIVGTSSNFGILGEKPTHPALLDYLADRLVASGWSLKAIHREIMRSATYQLSTDLDPQNFQVDADNRYLWRANRRRLDVEAWRDAFLAVSGRLDPTVGGPSLDLADTGNRRRTLYAKISRHNLDSLLRLFDFPDPNITSDKRSQTTIPQQQLFVLNSPFVVDQARALVDRVRNDAGPKADEAARINRAYLLLYGRPADEDETTMGVAYLGGEDDPATKRLSRWERYAQVLLSSNEFLYLD
ncbi:DUF1553 domain-containing protein [Singulisphaera sp. PoT]|uniref:DUF1553 domain-containing protein n=1 Tax=Singulisphaera sp. PoT TaxID=3411797 RepID=UPI003BF4A1FB